jgi:hypothetical protein
MHNPLTPARSRNCEILGDIHVAQLGEPLVPAAGTAEKQAERAGRGARGARQSIIEKRRPARARETTIRDGGSWQGLGSGTL